MILPELRRTVKQFFQDKGEPISLNLKSSFDSTVGSNEARWYQQNGYFQIAAALMGGLPAWSGEIVSRETALCHSVVFACAALISKLVGAVPALLNQRIDERSTREIPQHPMYAAMKYQPNEELSARSFSELLTQHCLLDGVGFAKIIRRSGTGVAMELYPLMPSQVKIDREKTGQKRLVYLILNENGAVDKTYTLESGKPHDILHLKPFSPDGVRGYNIVEKARQSIGSAIAAERNLAGFFANGGRLPYYLERLRDFADDEEAKAWRSKWEERMANPASPPIITDGTKYHSVGTSMRDAQGIENRTFVISEICRWFNISPTLVGDISRATFNNQEQYMLQFVRMTLQDWLTCWEQDFRRCVLTPAEREAGIFLRHDIRELLRGDFQTQMTGFATALQNGYFSIDEVRDELDMNPLPDGAGSHYHIQVNMGTLDSNGQLQSPKTLVRVDQSTQGATA